MTHYIYFKNVLEIRDNNFEYPSSQFIYNQMRSNPMKFDLTSIMNQSINSHLKFKICMDLEFKFSYAMKIYFNKLTSQFPHGQLCKLVL